MTLKRYRGLDKAYDAPDVYTTKRIGRTQALTPEGFLYCSEVPIKRTGTMMYAPGETPIKPGKDHVAYVTRDESALFAAAAVASYQGKPVVDDHPPEDVTPGNWKKYAKGLVLNPRRGEGDQADVLLADLLITDAETIKAVLAGKREVSAGYEADYEQTGEGEGRQANIIGNHIALVTKGRCGPRCSISDHQPSASKGQNPMTTKTASPRRVKLVAAIRQSFLDAGENVAATLAGQDDDDDMPGPGGDSDGSTHIHIHANGASAGGEASPAAATGGAPATPAADGTMTQDDPTEARFQKIEGVLAQILEKLGGGPAAAPAGPLAAAKDEAPDDSPSTGADDLDDGAGDTKPGGNGIATITTKDSAALATAFQKTVADAEILVPGFKVPTFDAALPRAKAVDSICRLRRSVLSHLASTSDGTRILASVGDSGEALDVSAASCADVAVVFKAAAATKRLANNRSATGDAGSIPRPAGPKAAPSPAELNRINQEYWASRGVKH